MQCIELALNAALNDVSELSYDTSKEAHLIARLEMKLKLSIKDLKELRKAQTQAHQAIMESVCKHNRGSE